VIQITSDSDSLGLNLNFRAGGEGVRTVSAYYKISPCGSRNYGNCSFSPRRIENRLDSSNQFSRPASLRGCFKRGVPPLLLREIHKRALNRVLLCARHAQWHPIANGAAICFLLLPVRSKPYIPHSAMALRASAPEYGCGLFLTEMI